MISRGPHAFVPPAIYAERILYVEGKKIVSFILLLLAWGIAIAGGGVIGVLHVLFR